MSNTLLATLLYDGELSISPVDITYLSGGYDTTLTLAASRETISASVVHAPSYTVAASREASITANAGHSPSISLPASHTPSIAKGGTP